MKRSIFFLALSYGALLLTGLCYPPAPAPLPRHPQRVSVKDVAGFWHVNWYGSAYEYELKTDRTWRWAFLVRSRERWYGVGEERSEYDYECLRWGVDSDGHLVITEKSRNYQERHTVWVKRDRRWHLQGPSSENCWMERK